MERKSIPVCEFSKQPAKKVCMHPACDQIPFLCEGQCVSHACTKLHKHQGQFRLIDYSSLQHLVLKLEDPNRVQEELIESVTESITELIESLKLMMQRFRATMLSRDMTFRSSMVIISTLQKLKSNEFSKLTGKEMSKLLDSSQSQNQNQIQTKIRSQKSKISNIIESIEQLINYYHGSYDFRQKSQKYLDEATRMSITQPKESLSQYDKAIQFNPNNSIAIIKRAQIHNQLGQYSQALVDYERVLNLDPNNHVALNAKGVILQDKFMRCKDSICCYSKAIDLNPLQVSYFVNRCNAYIQISDYKSALMDINRIIEMKSNESWFYSKRAEIYRKLNNEKQAQKDQKKSQQLKSKLKSKTSDNE